MVKDITRDLLHLATEVEGVDPEWGTPFKFQPIVNLGETTPRDTFTEGILYMFRWTTWSSLDRVQFTGSVYPHYVILRHRSHLAYIRCPSDITGYLQGCIVFLTFNPDVQRLEFLPGTRTFNQEDLYLEGENVADRAPQEEVLRWSACDLRCRERFQEAIQVATSGLQIFPNSISLQRELCLAAIGAGKLEQARSLLNEFILQEPTNPSLPNALGEVEQGRGRPIEAIVATENSRALDRTSYYTLHKLAKRFFLAKEWDRAIPALQEAINFKDATIIARDTLYTPELRAMLGHAYLHTGHYCEAEQSFIQCLNTAPDDSKVTEGLLEIYKRQKRCDEYMRTCEGLLAKEPNRLDYWQSLEKIYRKREDMINLGRVLKSLVKLAPGHVQYWLDLALIAMDSNDYTLVEVAFENMQSLSHTADQAALAKRVQQWLDGEKEKKLWEEAQLMVAQGNWTTAEHRLKELTLKFPKSAYYSLLGDVLVQQGEYARAIEAYLATKQFSEISSSMFLKIAPILAKEGKWDALDAKMAQLPLTTQKSTWTAILNSGLLRNDPAAIVEACMRGLRCGVDKQLLWFLFHAQREIGNAVAIQTVLEQLRAITPEDPFLWQAQWEYWMEAKKYNLATSAIEHWIALEPTSLAALGANVKLKKQLQDWVKLGEACETMLKLPGGQEDGAIWGDLGLAYLHQKRWAPGLNAFQKAASINPAPVQWQVGLGICLYKVEQFKESIGVLVKALKSSPPRSDEARASSYYLGKAYFKDQNWAESARILSLAISNSAPPRARIYLGGALMQLGKLQDARQEFEQVLKTDPQNPWAEKGLKKLAEIYSYDPR